MANKIMIDSASLSPEELKQFLDAEVEGVEFNLEKAANLDTVRVIDPTVVTAIVSGVFGFLAAMLGAASKRQARNITVIGKSGWQVRVPADTPPNEIHKFIDAAQEKDIEVVEI